MALFPRMYHVSQDFPRPVVTNIDAVTMDALQALHLEKSLSSGDKIGITVGSRGIQNLLPLLSAVIHLIKSSGAIPYLLAAMGSHGGGTEPGQHAILESLGITEEALGAAVITCAESKIIAHTPSKLPVYVVESALQMDGILIVNRVKTHTSFKGMVESGLTKMIAVGLGGPKGAQQFHGCDPGELASLLLEIGEASLKSLPILGGIAIVENAYEETALICAVETARMIEQESELLTYSKSLMPSLPVDKIDLLVIREMGKNFSGTGIDTNIIGRARIQGVPEPLTPTIKRIAVLDLSKESHGNATGLGMADFTTKKLVDKMDRKATYLNCLTSTFVARGAIPIYFDSEEELFQAALFSLSSIDPHNLRIVIIPNTLYLSDCQVSSALLPEISVKDTITIGDVVQPFSFNAQGDMLYNPELHRQ